MELRPSKKDGKPTFIEKRAFSRFPSCIAARFFFGNMFYTGTIMDLSKGGMFINTRMSLPVDSALVVIMRGRSQSLNINARVKRISKREGDSRGIGVELVSPSNHYLNYVSGLKSPD